MLKHYLQPDWPAPKNIHAYTTTRQDGFSQGSFASFNLAAHAGDDKEAVNRNRAELRQALNLSAEPVWLNQVHGTTVVIADQVTDIPEADASLTTKPGIVCATLTADCLPLLVCNKAGTWVAAIHAGWRGLAAGIIEATVKAFPCAAEELLIWLGPAIGPTAFETGPEVRDLFLQFDNSADKAFAKITENKWLANIYLLAKQRLYKLGVKNIYGGNECTYIDAQRFYSYRREQTTGRMASLIWRETLR